MTRTQQITLDVYEAPYFLYVNAKQRDNDSRVLVVTLTDQGKEIRPDHTKDTAVFRARKPDGTCVLDPATIGEDGKITVALSDQTLAVPGDVEADIAVVNGDDILSTASFYIQVARAPLGQEIVSENEFLVMVEAAARAEEAARAANEAAGLIEGMTVSASKVAAGGSPTAKLTKKDGHYDLDLGLVTGDKGAKGDAATVQIGTVTTGEPGSSASVKNSGTATDAKLDFVIPQGPVGPAGGVDSVNGQQGDVVIGGANILTGTRDFSGENWYSSSIHIFDENSERLRWEKAEPYKGFTVVKANFIYWGISQHIELEGNKNYVFSLYVKAERTAGEGPILARMYSSNNSYGKIISFNPTPEWKRYSFPYFPTTDLKSDSNINAFPHVELYENGGENCTIYVCGLKLEEGNVPTNWDPAPEDIPSMAPVQSVNGGTGDVVVGGVNLYTGTRDFSGSDWRSLNSWTREAEKYNGFTVLSRTNTYNGVYQELDVKAGDEYTLSFYGRADANKGMMILVDIIGPSATTLPVNWSGTFTPEWKRYSFSFVVNEAPGTLKMRIESTYDATIKAYICGLKMERGNGATDWSPAPEDKADVPEVIIAQQIADRIYEGVDLTVRHAAEISGYTDPWAWVRARIKVKDYSGIHVGDYIPFTCTNQVKLNAEVAGINTYRGYGDQEVPEHIDFISRELWPTRHNMNKVTFNNGISTEVQEPWLASDLHYWINSLSGNVPGGAAVGGAPLEAVDYTKDGIWHFLPADLQTAITASQPKRILLPRRYSASGLLTDDTGFGWNNMGKLWIPSEREVYGTAVWGNFGYGVAGFRQYPIFASKKYAKLRNGSLNNWWLLVGRSINSTHFAVIGKDGCCHAYTAAATDICAPVCFRLTA